MMKLIKQSKNLVGIFLTCSNADQFLLQDEELHVRLRIFIAKFLKFGAHVP
jgi:hypothetical protein